MEKVSIDPKNIDHSLIAKAAKSLLKGAIVALPTETVYGLGAWTKKKGAQDKLYAIKKRPKDKPFSFAVASIDKALDEYFTVLPPFGYRLIERLWPGPLTIIYYQPDNKKVGLRVPAHIVTSQILQELDGAVYLASANLSGQPDATTAAEVENIFHNDIDLIVDSGPCTYSKPSTILDLTEHPFKVLRAGVVSEQEIGTIFVKKRIVFVCTGNSCRSPMAQFLLTKYLTQERPFFQQRYEIISRGISAFPGSKATEQVVSLMKKEEAIDAGGFHSQRLTRYTILSSDLIFTMEDAQTDYILKLEPSVEGRVFCLKKFLPFELEKDIPDPIGQSDQVYNQVYSLIKEAVRELKEWI